MYKTESSGIYYKDSFEMFRKLNLFSNAETFKVLIQNNIGDSNLKISEIITPDEQPAFFEFIDLVEKSLKMIGDCKHSFDFVKDNDNWIKPCLILHYPEFTLTMIDKPDKKHDIKDLYVLLIIERVYVNDKVKYTFAAQPYVWRETFTLEEAQTKYVHSHIQKYYKREVVSRFCIGTSSIPDILYKMVNPESGNYDEPSFEAYFLLLDAMMKTESTEGHPYISIENIGTKGNNYDEPGHPDITKWLTKFTENIDTLKLFYDFYLNNIEIQKDLSIKIKSEMKFREGILNFCREHYRELLYYKSGEVSIFYDEVAGLGNQDHQIEADKFIFSGQEHQVKVIIPEKEEEENIDLNGFSLREDYITDLINILGYEFNKELLEYNGIDNR